MAQAPRMVYNKGVRGYEKKVRTLEEEFMIDIEEELKEVSANLRLVKSGIQQEDNKEEIDRALWLIIKSIDHIVDKISE